MMISDDKCYKDKEKFLLIVKDNVRSPDVVAGNVKLGHSAIFVRVPFQLVVPPELKY